MEDPRGQERGVYGSKTGKRTANRQDNRPECTSITMKKVNRDSRSVRELLFTNWTVGRLGRRPNKLFRMMKDGKPTNQNKNRVVIIELLDTSGFVYLKPLSYLFTSLSRPIIHSCHYLVTFKCHYLD
eukprot:GHVU01021632.1.p1 GENE.GHVU01021632.1~~GHVU01021632.1.p1  ORF type:complete len:127 (+),score=0.40 GHVU01021632.1:552-932(+)